MKFTSGKYTTGNLLQTIQEIELALTKHWLTNSYAVTDTVLQDDFKKRIEDASMGRNTVRFDSNGIPVILCRFLPDEIGTLEYLDTGTGVHPAFITDGSVKPFEYAKYLAGRVGSTNYPTSLPGLEPAHTIDFDDSITLCVDGDSGFHLATNAEWALVSLLSMAKGFQARGNTGYGRAHDATDEWGEGTHSHGDRYGRTLTGSGPLFWRHDGTPFGIADMVGNVREWVGGLRIGGPGTIPDGEIHIIPNNNAGGAERTLAAHANDSADWKAIMPNGYLEDP